MGTTDFEGKKIKTLLVERINYFKIKHL